MRLENNMMVKKEIYTMSNQVRICKYCRAQNSQDSVKCWKCEQPLYGSVYATEISPIDAEKQQARKKKREHSR